MVGCRADNCGDEFKRLHQDARLALVADPLLVLTVFGNSAVPIDSRKNTPEAPDSASREGTKMRKHCFLNVAP